ncbi:uncharacterized protein LOC133204816 [Saccostrea echinata]|uniref:uncharacterized protein LOC133204816 n=1 Tax=Saccostrea echinata TaxID=191078 RepID=UPI002A808587|nr:uncharacterized protein LOC133204816 [Saccostrea echinata]
MPFQRFSRSRRQPKWIFKQILADNISKRPAHPAKIVKHVSGPLADGSVVKEISDFEVYIKAVFSPESLNEIRSEYDSELDWSKALIILNKYTVEFKSHEELKFCEFYIRVEKFQIWDVQEGFDLKEDVKFCMDNTAVQERAKVKWDEMRSCHSESFSLTQFLEAMIQNTSTMSQSQKGSDSLNTFPIPEESQSFPVNINVAEVSPEDNLKSTFSPCEFIISNSQQKELENIKEWEENYIPAQSENESPPMDIPSYQPSHSVDSPDDIQPGQPNQDRERITITTDKKKSKENRMADKETVKPKEKKQAFKHDVENDQSIQTNNSMINPNSKDNTNLNGSKNKNNTEVCTSPSDAIAGATQEFIPQLGYEDMIGTAPFSPHLSPNSTGGQKSPDNNSGNSVLFQETSPILISSSGETNKSSSETPSNSGKGSEENPKNSSEEPQFHLEPPIVSPETLAEKSRESPRLQCMTRSAKKTFQDHFEMMIESERLKDLAGEKQPRSRKRLLDESSEDETMDKRKKISDGDPTVTEEKNSEKSNIGNNGGRKSFVFNVVDKLLNLVGRSPDSSGEKSTNVNDGNSVDLDENILNLTNSFSGEPCEASQSLLQSSKKVNTEGLPEGKKQSDSPKKSKNSPRVLSERNITVCKTIQDEGEGKETEGVILISDRSTEGDSQEAGQETLPENSDREAKEQAKMIEQDQEISSSLGSEIPVVIVLPRQAEPQDEIGQKLYHLKLPPDLKTRVINYWKK